MIVITCAFASCQHVTDCCLVGGCVVERERQNAQLRALSTTARTTQGRRPRALNGTKPSRVKKIALVLGIILLPSLAGAHTFRVALGASIGADAADLATTLQARQRGAVEANPLLRPALVPLKVAVASGFAVALWRLHRTHPRMATGLLIGNAALKGWASWHNARVLR